MINKSLKEKIKDNWIVFIVVVLIAGLYIGIIIGSAPYYMKELTCKVQDMEFQYKFYKYEDLLSSSISMYNNCANTANKCINVLEENYNKDFNRFPLLPEIN